MINSLGINKKKKRYESCSSYVRRRRFFCSCWFDEGRGL